MEKEFYQEVKRELFSGVEQCTDDQKLLFRKIYAYKHPNYTMSRVVNSIPRDKLSNAMRLVKTTLDTNKA